MTLRLIALLIFLALFTSSNSIRVTLLEVPHQVGCGQNIQLHCHFDLNDHILYSVKWFKGPTVQYIERVLKEVTGTYRCEVSGEAPHFETDYMEANMTVIDLPTHGPIIVNVQTSYQPGEWANLNCTSAPSNPRAQLYWYIDGEFAPEPYVKRYGLLGSDSNRMAARSAMLGERSTKYDEIQGSEGFGDVADSISVVGLEFIVNLPMKPPTGTGFAVRYVACVAFVGDIYKSETPAYLVVADKRQPSTKIPITTIQLLSRFHSNNGGHLNNSLHSTVCATCFVVGFSIYVHHFK